MEINGIALHRTEINMGKRKLYRRSRPKEYFH